MKALQKKRNIDNTHHQVQSIKVPLQVRPFAEPQEQTQQISDNQSSLESSNSKPGFNFAEIPVYPAQPPVTPRVQPKFTITQAKLESPTLQRAQEEDEPQAKLESPTLQRVQEEDEPQAKLESPAIQRVQEEDEPQAKLESPTLQRVQEEDEPQAKLESSTIQRAQEEDEPQAKLESPTIQRAQEEDEPQAKLESPTVQRAQEEDEPQAKLESSTVQRQDDEDEPQAKLESSTIQRAQEEDEPQAKLESPAVQRQDEKDEPAQMKVQSLPTISENKGPRLNRQFAPMQVKLNLAPQDSDQTLPKAVQRKMEWAFNTDFSGVRVHTGPQAKLIQAKAFTKGSNIHFQPDQYNPHSQQGQELLGHELTHVVQQRAGRVNKKPQSKGNSINFDYQLEAEADTLGAKAAKGEQVEVAGAKSLPKLYSSQTIQRKTQEITSLPDHVVTKGSIFKNRTEKMQKYINKYNKILLTDTNYKKQLKILNKIETEVREWFREHTIVHKGQELHYSKDLFRKDDILKMLNEVVKEQTNVKMQKTKSSSTYADRFKQNVIGDKTAEAVNAGSTGYSAVKSSGVLTDKEQTSFGQITKVLVEGIKNYFEKREDSKIAELSEIYKSEISKYPALSILGSIASICLSIYNIIDSYAIKKALASSLNSLKIQKKVDDYIENHEDEDSNIFNADEKSDLELRKSLMYGYAKVNRRFYGAIYDLISNIISFIGKILTFAGVTAIAGSIIEVGRGIVDLVLLALRKIKGFYKILTGKRGVQRENNAKNIVEQALKGNTEALALLVKLDPLGKALRWYGPGQEFGGLPKPQNNTEMLEFLNQTKTNPKRYGTTNTFITAIAEQLKSF